MMLCLLGIYMWLYLHRPYEVWPVMGDLHVVRIHMVATIACWALVANKSWTKNRLNPAFLAFFVAFFVSWLVSPYGDAGTVVVQRYAKIGIFYLLVISSAREEKDLKRLAVIFLAAFALYMVHSLWEYCNGRHEYRQGIRRMIGVDMTFSDPNSFAGSVVLALPMVLPLWQHVKTRYRWLLAGYVALAVTCILLTGSRMGFAGLCCFAAILPVLSKHRSKAMVLLVLCVPFAWYALPDSLQRRFLTIVDSSYGSEAARASADGRVKGFYTGVRLWSEQPLLGVGPGSYGVATGRGFQSHNLYGQVLGELGSLGAAAFGAIVAAFLANAVAARRLCLMQPALSETFSAQMITAVTVAVVLLLVMGFGGHNLYRYTWLWFGAFEVVALRQLLVSSQQPSGIDKDSATEVPLAEPPLELEWTY